MGKPVFAFVYVECVITTESSVFLRWVRRRTVTPPGRCAVSLLLQLRCRIAGNPTGEYKLKAFMNNVYTGL